MLVVPHDAPGRFVRRYAGALDLRRVDDVSGTTPQGPFHGSRVSIAALTYGCDTPPLFRVEIQDDTTGVSVVLLIGADRTDAGVTTLASTAAIAVGQSVANPLEGAVQVSADDLSGLSRCAQPDAGMSGTVTATIQVSQGGFDLSGTFSSAVCQCLPCPPSG